jgi:hypothetical protein
MFCRGGLAWWRGYVLVGCTDRYTHQDHVAIYSSSENLDERNVVLRKSMPKPVTLLSVYGDYVLSYSFSRRVFVFKLAVEAGGVAGARAEVTMTQHWTLDILGHIPSPHCIVTLSLISMGAESHDPHSCVTFCPTPSAVLCNAAGKVMVFPIDHAGHGRRGGQPPALLATNVEMCWAPCAWHVDVVQRQLSQAIWLACGAEGMKVWMTLLPQSGDELALTKRVMLPFPGASHTLSVLFYDLVLVGSESDASPVALRGGLVLPNYTLQRQAHLYLHHILKQVCTYADSRCCSCVLFGL